MIIAYLRVSKEFHWYRFSPHLAAFTIQGGLWYCIYMVHFLYGYIQMRFTTLCGGLTQTQLYGAVHNLFNVRSRIHRGP